jgi:3-isopropylmalate/(R)-2-methylmalate dehydratase small subunit
LQIAGARAVIAPSYARIFYRNAVDGGFVVPAESLESLLPNFATGDEAELNLREGFIQNQRTGQTYPIKGLGQVAEILEAGGIFNYARQKGMIESMV